MNQAQRPCFCHACGLALAALAVGLAAGSLAGAQRARGAEEPSAKVRWLADLDEGLKLAAETKRDLLVNFTGHGWCYSCELLEHDVLGKPEFAAAAEHFVLVELDFPQGEAADPAVAARVARDRAWQEKYFTPGVPTVVLVDAAGRPYAYTGYEPGMTPASFLQQLDRYRSARASRDRAMRDAAGKTGAGRAKALDAALECVAPHLGTLAERGGDPLLAWYGGAIGEISRLDGDDGLGLKSKYARRRESLRQFVATEQVFEKLKEIKSHPAAIALLDGALKQTTDTKLTWRLERTRQTYLEWDDQNDAALANAQRLLKRDDLTRDERDRLKGRVAFNLKNLHRYSEAVAVLDELIATNDDRPGWQRDALESKAFYLGYAADEGEDREASLAAFKTWRARCKQGSEEWQRSTALLALQLQKLGRFEEALALRLELVELERSIDSLYRLFETYHALGKTAEATKTLSEVEQLTAAMETTRPSDKETKDFWTAKVEEMRGKLARPKD